MGTAQASDALENLFIDHLFRSTKWTAPAALWVALFTGAPSDAGGGIEVSSGAYTRVNLPPSDSNWTATQGGTSGISIGTGGPGTQPVALRYSHPSADSGTVGGVWLFPASIRGVLFYWGPLPSPRHTHKREHET